MTRETSKRRKERASLLRFYFVGDEDLLEGENSCHNLDFVLTRGLIRLRVRVRLNRVRFQHLRPVSSLSDSSGKTGIVHCRRINSQSKEERKQWKSTKTIQQLFSSYSEKRLESQCHLKGEIEQSSIPTLTTGFVLVGLIRQDWRQRAFRLKHHTTIVSNLCQGPSSGMFSISRYIRSSILSSKEKK